MTLKKRPSEFKKWFRSKNSFWRCINMQERAFVWTGFFIFLFIYCVGGGIFIKWVVWNFQTPNIVKEKRLVCMSILKRRVMVIFIIKSIFFSIRQLFGTFLYTAAIKEWIFIFIGHWSEIFHRAISLAVNYLVLICNSCLKLPSVMVLFLDSILIFNTNKLINYYDLASLWLNVFNVSNAKFHALFIIFLM